MNFDDVIILPYLKYFIRCQVDMDIPHWVYLVKYQVTIGNTIITDIFLEEVAQAALAGALRISHEIVNIAGAANGAAAANDHTATALVREIDMRDEDRGHVTVEGGQGHVIEAMIADEDPGQEIVISVEDPGLDPGTEITGEEIGIGEEDTARKSVQGN